MFILVTGGAGFIGSPLVDALVERGHQVRVLDALVAQVHGEAERPAHLNPEAEFLRGDVCDEQTLERALEGVEVVYHEAAEVGVGQSMYEMQRYVRANTFGTSVLLEHVVARRAQVSKLVVASSMSIYGGGAYACPTHGKVSPQLRPTAQLQERRWERECERCGSELRPLPTGEDKPLFPTSVYAITKQDQEQLCLVVGRAYGIPSVALRYFNVYGTRQALSNPYTGVCAIFSSRLLNGQRPVIFEDGAQARDFVHVSDIVQANLLALETDRADYQAVNVGTGRATSVGEVARLLSEGLGREHEAEFVGKYREGDIRHCIADITRARTLLGYSVGRRVRLGLSLIDVRECVIADDVRVGHLNLIVGVGKFSIGDHARIGHLNVIRGGDEVRIGRYAEIIRLNEINSIPDPVVVNATDPRFQLGDGSVITAGHKIDFTDRVRIGRRTIIGGRNSSLWTHNRQRTLPISIGDFAYVGSEIRMAPGASIPSRCIVGIGSVITTEISSEEYLIAGVPAKPIKELQQEDKFLIERKTRLDLPDDV